MIGPIILQVVLIFLNAVFASAEIAVISMNDNKLYSLADNGDNRAVKLVKLTEQPARFLATIQVAITLAGLLGSAFAADNFAKPLVALIAGTGIGIPVNILNTVSVFLITLILAYFNLVFGELVPKRLAMKKAESMALGMSGMLYSVSKIFAPLVFLLTASTNLLLRLMGINPEEEEDKVSEEEIKMLLLAGKKQGTIDSEETDMIQNVFAFDDIPVEQICTHRIDVNGLELADELKVWEAVIHESRHTFYPIYDENVDDVVGILDTKDYFRMRNRTKERIMKEAVDKAFFIPETMTASILFQHMKKNRCYFAVVIDEYGGLTGIVTLHDLMETLVGDLYDSEEEALPQEIEKIGEHEWRVQGFAELQHVAEKLKVKLPVEIYDTFSGFICGIIGRIPEDNASFECQYDELKIIVHTVHDRRVHDTTVITKSS